jgi:hypothetical protein
MCKENGTLANFLAMSSLPNLVPADFLQGVNLSETSGTVIANRSPMITQLFLAAHARIIPGLLALGGALLVPIAGGLYLLPQRPVAAAVGIATPSTQPSAAAPAVETAAQPAPVVPPPPTDIELAQAAMSRGDAGSAMLYLFRDLDREPAGQDALPMLVKCASSKCAEECGEGEYIRALSLLAQLSDRCAAARQARMGAAAQAVPLDDLETTESQVREIDQAITASADEQAGPHIVAAARHAADAHYHWYSCGPNDRGEVREGLRELRWIQEHGAPLSPDMMGKYQQALDQFKALVADSEWQPMLAEAGFTVKENAQ